MLSQKLNFLETLQELTTDELDLFKWHLQQPVNFVGDLRPLKASALEKANRQQIVDLITGKYDPNDAQEIVDNILKRINRNDQVQTFAKIPKDGPLLSKTRKEAKVTMCMLKGETLTFVHVGEVKTIHWKQGSFFGFGGDKTQSYHECTYKNRGGQQIPVYIQVGFKTPPQILKVDHTFQYGVYFLVLHDKSQTPFQKRFMMNSVRYAYDLSWVDGEYLRDFE